MPAAACAAGQHLDLPSLSYARLNPTCTSLCLLQLVERANDWTQRLGFQDQVHYVYSNATISLGTMMKGYPGPVDRWVAGPGDIETPRALERWVALLADKHHQGQMRGGQLQARSRAAERKVTWPRVVKGMGSRFESSQTGCPCRASLPAVLCPASQFAVLCPACLPCVTFRPTHPTQPPISFLIQFPDPHFKKRHRKRRIFQRELVHAVRDLLPPGGKHQLAR